MAAKKSGRLRQIASEFSVGIHTIQEFLAKKGFDIGTNPNAKISEEMYGILESEFQSEKTVKEASEKLAKERINEKLKNISAKKSSEKEEEVAADSDSVDDEDIDLKEDTKPSSEEKAESKESPAKKDDNHIKVETNKPKVLGKIDLDKKPKAKEEEEKSPDAEATPQEKPAETKKPAEAKEEKKEEPKVEKKEEAEKEEAKKEEVQKTAEKAEESAPEKKATEEKVDKTEEKVEEKKETQAAEQKTEPKKEAQEEKPQAEAKEDKAEKEDNSKLQAPKVLGKIDLPERRHKKKEDRKEDKSDNKAEQNKKAEQAESKKDSEKAKESKSEDKDKSSETEDKSPDDKKEVEDKNFYKTKYSKLAGPTVVGKIELPKKKVASSADDPKKEFNRRKKKRRRIKKEVVDPNKAKKPQTQKPTPKPNKQSAKPKKKAKRVEPSEEDIQKKMKETLARLEGKKSSSIKHRKNKRRKAEDRHQQDTQNAEKAKKTLQVTEFVSANELANMLGVDVNQIIKTCMSLGLFVSINQRLDAETITIVAEEYDHEVDFVSADVIEEISESQVEDKEEDYIDRSPIVTVMGHVDHGKTSLLDYIRETNVIAGEAGGITQHIGAYEVEYEGKTITFLDTPGHEAFTAMRARGSKITDIAIIVIAADDRIMPQTKEAINHAQAAGVPIVFAINKIDRPSANPEKIKEELANMNLLVEDWGGKYQSQDISAKEGTNTNQLLEKVLLESELLELKGNPKIPATGVVLEASLDKGRGYVAKLLVRNGSLKIGDTVLAGTTYGRVKAMFNERNQKVDKIGPSQPSLVLGLHSAPQAGDTFNVMLDEKEAKAIANKREQLQREQGARTQKHITLDEIGRRLAVGDFKELNIIVKGDVDGSVEALADSLIKLSTKEIQVNVIHKSVGQVNEADVMLAAASDAIIVAFQVRPSLQARKLAEAEQIDIRNYSIIYKAIDEVRDAMEGMLSPDVEEKIVCTLEVRDVFKITKVGTIAGCYVLDGKITRNTNVRVIRDGIIVFTGNLGSLKRFKDDVREVNKGYECGLNIENFNDIKVGDQIEGFENIEVKRKL